MCDHVVYLAFTKTNCTNCLFSKGAKAIGALVVNLVHILNPSMVVLCGVLAPVYFETVRNVVRKDTLPSASNLDVRASSLQEPALLGAASLVLEYATRRTY